MSNQFATFSKQRTSDGCKCYNMPLSSRQTSLCSAYQARQIPFQSPVMFGCVHNHGGATTLHVTSTAGSKQGWGKKQKTLSLKCKWHQWGERRKLENAILVLGDACKTTDRCLYRGRCVSVEWWRGATTTPLVFTCTRVLVQLLYIFSEYICGLSVSCLVNFNPNSIN